MIAGGVLHHQSIVLTACSDISLSPSLQQVVPFEPTASTPPGPRVITCNRVGHSSAARVSVQNSRLFDLGASSPRQRSASSPPVEPCARLTARAMIRRMEEEEEIIGGGVWGERNLTMEVMAERAQAFYEDKGHHSFSEATKAVDSYIYSPAHCDGSEDRPAANLATEGRYCDDAQELNQLLGIPLPTGQQETDSGEESTSWSHSHHQSHHFTAIRAAKATCQRPTKRANSARRVRVSNHIAVIPHPAKISRRLHLASANQATTLFTPPLSEDEESDCESAMPTAPTTPGVSTLQANAATRRCMVTMDSPGVTDDLSEEGNDSFSEMILFPVSHMRATARGALSDNDAMDVAEVEDEVSEDDDHREANVHVTAFRDMAVDDRADWDSQALDNDMDCDAMSDDASQMSPPVLSDEVERRWLADLHSKSPDTSVWRHFTRIRSVEEVEEEAMANSSSPVRADQSIEGDISAASSWAAGEHTAPPSSLGFVTQMPTPSVHTSQHDININGDEKSGIASSFNPFGDSPQPFTTVPYSRGRNPPPVRSAFQHISAREGPANWKISNHSDNWQAAPGCGPVQRELNGSYPEFHLTKPAAMSDLDSQAAYRNIVPVDSRDLEALADWFALVLVTRLACPEPARDSAHSSNEWGPVGVLNGSLERTGALYQAHNASTPVAASSRHTHMHAYRPEDPFGILGRHVYSNHRIKADSRLSMIILNIIESRHLSAERVVAAAWFIERFCVHDFNNQKGSTFRHYLHSHGPEEKYPLELRLAVTAFMIADIGVGDVNDQWTLKAWADRLRIPTAHLHHLKLTALENVGYSAVIQPVAWLEHSEAVYRSVASAGFSDVRTGCRLLAIMDRMVQAAGGVAAQAQRDHAYFSQFAASQRTPPPVTESQYSPASVEMHKSRSYAEYDGATDFPLPCFEDGEEDDDGADVTALPSPEQAVAPVPAWPQAVAAHPQHKVYTSASRLRTDVNQLCAMAPVPSQGRFGQQNFSTTHHSSDINAAQDNRLPPIAPLSRWQIAPPSLNRDFAHMPPMSGWQGLVRA